MNFLLNLTFRTLKNLNFYFYCCNVFNSDSIAWNFLFFWKERKKFYRIQIEIKFIFDLKKVSATANWLNWKENSQGWCPKGFKLGNLKRVMKVKSWLRLKATSHWPQFLFSNLNFWRKFLSMNFRQWTKLNANLHANVSGQHFLNRI